MEERLNVVCACDWDSPVSRDRYKYARANELRGHNIETKYCDHINKGKYPHRALKKRVTGATMLIQHCVFCDGVNSVK